MDKPNTLQSANDARAEDFQRARAQNRSLRLARRFVDNPILLLLGVGVASMIPFCGYLIIGEDVSVLLSFSGILNLVLIGAIVMIPVVSIISWRTQKIELRLLKDSDLLHVAESAIEQEQRILEAKLPDSIPQVTPIGHDQLKSILLEYPERGSLGPRNTTYTFKDPFPFIIRDTDDYLEFSGRLLLVKTAFPHPVEAHRILLVGDQQAIRKASVFLGKSSGFQQTIALLPKASSVLAKIKRVASLTGSSGKFVLEIQKKEIALLFDEYYKFNDIDFVAIVDLLGELRESIPVLLN